MKLLVIGHRIFRLDHGIIEISKKDILNNSELLEIFYLRQNINSINCAREIGLLGTIRQFTSLERALTTLPPEKYAGMVADMFFDIQVRKNHVEVVIMDQINQHNPSLVPILLRATNNRIWNGYQFLYLGEILFLPMLFIVLLWLVFRYYNILLFLKTIC
jgi:hypothetical protein